MKIIKKTIGFLLAAAMLLSLAACGSFETRMAGAINKMQKLDSLHMDVDMEIGMTMSMPFLNVDSDLSISMKGGVDTVKEPAVTKMDLTVSAADLKIPVLYYIEKDGESYIIYISTDGGKSWDKETATLDELPAQAQTGNTLEQIGFFLQCAKTFGEAGTETVNGSEARRYDGVIEGEYVQQAVEMSGILDTLAESMELDLGNVDLSASGSIPASIWIDNKSGMIVRYDMDLTSVMNGVMSMMLEQMLASYGLETAGDFGVSIKLTSAVISVTLSEFNSVGEIVIPDAAKAA